MAKGVKTGGRKPGTPNKATTEFRQTITHLLEKNASKVDRWLQQVADGNGDAKPDPAKALDLLAKLAEYGAPKLSRSEIDATVKVKPLHEELAALNAVANARGNSPVA
jgi:hypothetical protein